MSLFFIEIVSAATDAGYKMKIAMLNGVGTGFPSFCFGLVPMIVCMQGFQHKPHAPASATCKTTVKSKKGVSFLADLVKMLQLQ
jgi:hypothetical protein